MRTLSQLTADTSGWPYFLEMTKTATNPYQILPADSANAKKALYQTQVTTHSIMGAIIYFSGGVLIDNGWIRILGSGNVKLDRSLPGWNKGKTINNDGERPGFLLVADDVIGGFFAINGGALGNDAGKMYYLGPDDLQWEDLNIGYTDFINFCLTGNLDKFYQGLKWKGCQQDVAKITGNQAFDFYPYLWTKEGKDINKDIRKVISVEELYDFEAGKINKPEN